MNSSFLADDASSVLSFGSAGDAPSARSLTPTSTGKWWSLFFFLSVFLTLCFSHCFVFSVFLPLCLSLSFSFSVSFIFFVFLCFCLSAFLCLSVCQSAFCLSVCLPFSLCLSLFIFLSYVLLSFSFILPLHLFSFFYSFHSLLASLLPPPSHHSQEASVPVEGVGSSKTALQLFLLGSRRASAAHFRRGAQQRFRPSKRRSQRQHPSTLRHGWRQQVGTWVLIGAKLAIGLIMGTGKNRLLVHTRF